MAKYTVDHTCGHTETHQLIGPHKERDRKLNWLGTTLCSSCYRAEQDRKREKANAKASEANKSNGLPDLEGSDKQIAWAESIRLRVCELIRKSEVHVREEIAECEYSDQICLEITDALTLLTDEIVQQTSAKWWIETGQHLPITYVWFFKQIKQRGLAPSYTAYLASNRGS